MVWKKEREREGDAHTNTCTHYHYHYLLQTQSQSQSENVSLGKSGATLTKSDLGGLVNGVDGLNLEEDDDEEGREAYQKELPEYACRLVYTVLASIRMYYRLVDTLLVSIRTIG